MGCSSGMLDAAWVRHVKSEGVLGLADGCEGLDIRGSRDSQHLLRQMALSQVLPSVA